MRHYLLASCILSVLPTVALSVSSDILITGQDPYSRFGNSVACGDVNNDGFDDLLVGADLGRHWLEIRRAGEVYVFYGSAQHSVVLDLTIADPDLTISGVTDFDSFGHAVRARDISGDGIDDIIATTRFGLPGQRDGAGEVHVVFGRSDFLPNDLIDLQAGLGDIHIIGAGVRDQTGFSLSTGDMNDDGIQDLILGAPGYPGQDIESRGKVYVFFGGSIPTGVTIDLDIVSADLEFVGESPASALGASLGVGDLNDDGVDDLIIGASRTGNDAGKVYVFFGGGFTAGTLIELATTVADIEIDGASASDGLGVAVAAGKVGNDTVDDLVISAHNAANGMGKIYVFHGGAIPSGTTIDLGVASADLEITGDEVLSLFGWTVEAGDTNGDGADDIVVGSIGADNAGQEDTGKLHIFQGPLASGALGVAAADQTVIGAAPGDELGVSLAFGDTNNDGLQDLFAGAARANGLGTLYGFRGATQASESSEIQLRVVRNAGLPPGLAKKRELPPAFE